MVIHCHFTVPDVFLYTQKCFLLSVTVLTLYNISLFWHLIFVTFSFMKGTISYRRETFAIMLTKTEPYILMFCSHWIGNDLVFSSNPWKGENRHCWVCPVPWDSRTVVALSVLTIASYLHTGKLLRYFLRWLVLMLGFFNESKLKLLFVFFRPACFAYLSMIVPILRQFFFVFDFYN